MHQIISPNANPKRHSVARVVALAIFGFILGCAAGSDDSNAASEKPMDPLSDDMRQSGDDGSTGGTGGLGAGGEGGAGGDSGGEGAQGGQRVRSFIPTPATLHRLSTAERRASIESVFGFVPLTTFEQETTLHGSARVANAELTISPQLTEQLETFAWAIADRLRDEPNRLTQFFQCNLIDGRASRPCIGAGILELGRQLWRRPLERSEIERLTSLYDAIRGRSTTAGSHHKALASVVSALIQAPDFAFRVEIGEPDPEQPAGQMPVIWRYTSDEMASRLSYFVWGTSPDEALRDAADDGSLLTEQGLRAQAVRLLDEPRAIPRFKAYFDELVGLEYLETVSKNADLFPSFSDSLRTSMRAEISDLFASVAFDRDTDFRELLTSTESSVDNELAALYGVSLDAQLPPGERVTVTLPEEQARGGLLGRAAPLALFSHATVIPRHSEVASCGAVCSAKTSPHRPRGLSPNSRNNLPVNNRR